MNRITKNENQANTRPRRRAAKTHFFKYQLSEDPRKVEQNDLRRALQESLEEQSIKHPVARKNAKINSTSNRAKLDVDSNNVNSTKNNSDTSSDCNNSSRYSTPIDSTSDTSAATSAKPPSKSTPKKGPRTIFSTQGTQTSPLTDLDLFQRRVVQSSWSFLGVPEEKVIYLRNDEPPRRLICYPAIKHIEGDVIQARDSVLLRSGPKKTDIPYIAKVCAFWQDATTGGMMMSLFWYYRPEHTEEGRKPHHLIDEIFASRHRDVDSVDCIEDKCYVLTFNEYCRYRKKCKMDQVRTNWSLADVTIPVSNEVYPRQNRIPQSDVNPELVFCCRQIYDSRMKRLIKNPLINPKYGHI